MLLTASCSAPNTLKASNASNYGYTTVLGQDIFYSKVILNDIYLYSNIYKYNSATNTETLLLKNDAYDINELNAFISPYKDKVFFLKNYLHDSVQGFSDNIYYVKTDGSAVDPEKLLTEDVVCSFMQIYDEKIYFYDEAQQMFYSVNIDGTEKKEICAAVTARICINEKYIYYIEYDTIFRVSLNGGKPETIIACSESEESFYPNELAVDSGYIYVIDDTYTYIKRIRINDKSIENLYEVMSGDTAYISHLNVSDGIIYFIIDSYGNDGKYAILSLVPGSGSPNEVVSGSNLYIDILPFTIWENIIYYYACPNDTIMNSDYILYTVPVTGGKPKPFKPRFELSDTFGSEETSDEESDITISENISG